MGETKMDNDLISRSELLGKFTAMLTFSSDRVVLIENVIKQIQNAPTVELDGYVLYGTGLELVSTDWLDEQLGKDRRRGEWTEDVYHNIVCPFCGGIRRDCRIDHINFCNRCGADMRGDKND